MDVIMLENVRHGREIYKKGERVLGISDDLGLMFCDAGIARDISGDVVTGNHVRHATLSITGTRQSARTNFDG